MGNILKVENIVNSEEFTNVYMKRINIYDNEKDIRPLGGAHLYRSPTSNCQFSSISGIQHLLSRTEDTRSIFKEIFKATSKRLVLIDINTGDNYEGKYERKIEEVFKEDRIVFKQPYKSTNGSKMTMYLLNIYEL